MSDPNQTDLAVASIVRAFDVATPREDDFAKVTMVGHLYRRIRNCGVEPEIAMLMLQVVWDDLSARLTADGYVTVHVVDKRYVSVAQWADLFDTQSLQRVPQLQHPPTESIALMVVRDLKK